MLFISFPVDFNNDVIIKYTKYINIHLFDKTRKWCYIVSTLWQGGMSMKEFIMLNIFICTGISDLQNYKIRNPVIVMGWFLSICINVFQYGFYGAAYTIFCILVTLVTGFPLFMTGGIGAGDVKLMSVIGGMYGLAFLGKVTLLFLVLAGAVSLVELIRKRALITRVKAFIYYLLHINTAQGKYYQRERDGREFTICLAPIMAAAYFLTLLDKSPVF